MGKQEIEYRDDLNESLILRVKGLYREVRWCPLDRKTSVNPRFQVTKKPTGRELVVYLNSSVPYRKDLAFDTGSFSRRVIREVKAQVKVCSLRGQLQATVTTWVVPAQPHSGQKKLQRAKSWAFEPH